MCFQATNNKHLLNSAEVTAKLHYDLDSSNNVNVTCQLSVLSNGKTLQVSIKKCIRILQTV